VPGPVCELEPAAGSRPVGLGDAYLDALGLGRMYSRYDCLHLWMDQVIYGWTKFRLPPSRGAGLNIDAAWARMLRGARWMSMSGWELAVRVDAHDRWAISSSALPAIRRRPRSRGRAWHLPSREPTPVPR
jgi:hypothetical protein